MNDNYDLYLAGINNIVGSIQQQTTVNTNLGDQGVNPTTPTPGPGNIITSFVSGVQQFIGNLQNNVPSPPNGTFGK